MEHMLLVALTSLYTDEREKDVRLGVLRVAINVLQRHGTALARLFSKAFQCHWSTCRSVDVLLHSHRHAVCPLCAADGYHAVSVSLSAACASQGVTVQGSG